MNRTLVVAMGLALAVPLGSGSFGAGSNAQEDDAIDESRLRQMTASELLTVLENGNEGQRYGAVKYLWASDDPRVPAALARALGDEGEYTPLVAALILASLPGREGVGVLIAALRNENSLEAAYALGKTTDTRAVEPLIEALGDESLRRTAARSLSRFSGPKASAARDAYLTPFIEQLADPAAPSSERASAAYALGESGDPKSVATLQAAEADPDPAVVEAARWALQAFEPAAPSDGSPPPVAGDEIPTPQKLRDARPQYPSIAKQARVQGIVILEAFIDQDGDVASIKILRGIPLLDDAAVRAVSLWKYAPTIIDGRRIPLVMTTTVNFSLS